MREAGECVECAKVRSVARVKRVCGVNGRGRGLREVCVVWRVKWMRGDVRGV